MCTEDCADMYLICSNGKVIEMPMAEETKCYRNRIVRTAADHYDMVKAIEKTAKAADPIG